MRLRRLYFSNIKAITISYGKFSHFCEYEEMMVITDRQTDKLTSFVIRANIHLLQITNNMAETLWFLHSTAWWRSRLIYASDVGFLKNGNFVKIY